MSDRTTIVNRIFSTGAIAVVRINSVDVLSHVVDALVRGGLDIIEITMTVPGAVEQIRKLSADLGDDALVGVGSVVDAQTAHKAIDAGAKYVVSPVLKDEVVEAARSRDVAVTPGTFTPSEAQRAHELGADSIKVFPANILGMDYFKSVLAPLPHLKLIPTGGVTPDNGGDWIRAGARAVGVGSALLDKKAIADGHYDVLTERSRVLIDNVQNALSSQSK